MLEQLHALEQKLTQQHEEHLQVGMMKQLVLPLMKAMAWMHHVFTSFRRAFMYWHVRRQGVHVCHKVSAGLEAAKSLSRLQHWQGTAASEHATIHWGAVS